MVQRVLIASLDAAARWRMYTIDRRSPTETRQTFSRDRNYENFISFNSNIEQTYHIFTIIADKILN